MRVFLRKGCGPGLVRAPPLPPLFPSLLRDPFASQGTPKSLACSGSISAESFALAETLMASFPADVTALRARRSRERSTSARLQLHPKPTSSSLLRFHPDASSHPLRPFSHNRQPKTRAGIRPFPVQPLEDPEHLFPIPRRNSDPVVLTTRLQPREKPTPSTAQNFPLKRGLVDGPLTCYDAPSPFPQSFPAGPTSPPPPNCSTATSPATGLRLVRSTLGWNATLRQLRQRTVQCPHAADRFQAVSHVPAHNLARIEKALPENQRHQEKEPCRLQDRFPAAAVTSTRLRQVRLRGRSEAEPSRIHPAVFSRRRDRRPRKPWDRARGR